MSISGFMSWRRFHSPDGSRLSKPLAARTVAKDRVVLGIVLGFGEDQEIVDSNPVRKVEAEEGDSREPLILDAAQYEALLGACEGHSMLEPYVLVLGEAGLRCDSEALWLRWQDIDLDSGFLTVESVRKGRRTKSGKSRDVPMTARLRVALREHMAAYRLRTYDGKRTPWVFHHELDRRHAQAGSRLGGLRRAFGSAVRRAGLPEDLHQHDLRHRRVTTWLDEGHPAHIVQQAMGHAQISTTMGYYTRTKNPMLQLVEEPSIEEKKALAEGDLTRDRRNSVSNRMWKTSETLEAPPGFEPGIKDLQSSALPLGHGA